MKKLQVMLAAALMLVLVLCAGCDPQGEKQAAEEAANAPTAVSTGSSSQKAASSSAAAKTSGSQTITLYFPDDNGMQLLGEQRKISWQQGGDKYLAAVQALLKGPQQKGAIAIFPRKAKVQSVTVKNGVAQVSFNRALKDDFVGGSTGEEMLVGSLVNTLTGFKEVQKVQLLIEGQAVESLDGHMDLSTPLGPMRDLVRK